MYIMKLLVDKHAMQKFRVTHSSSIDRKAIRHEYHHYLFRLEFWGGWRWRSVVISSHLILKYHNYLNRMTRCRRQVTKIDSIIACDNIHNFISALICLSTLFDHATRDFNNFLFTLLTLCIKSFVKTVFTAACAWKWYL